MKKAIDKRTADEIAQMAEEGKDITKYFTNTGKMRKSIQRVNVDFTVEMLHELDDVASELNISRQAVIKTYLRQSLDQHRLAKSKTG
jgi:hypothetical protein